TGERHDDPGGVQAAARPDPLVRLMETTTGVEALQEALQADRRWRAPSQAAPATIAIDGVPGAKLAPHPWARMLTALGRPVPAEPLAAVTPAEFYYLRAASVSVLLRVLDHADAWAS